MRNLKKFLSVVSVIAFAFVLVFGLSGTASADQPPQGPTYATIQWNDAAQTVTLSIPTPACDETAPNCVWMFFFNEPKLSVDLGQKFASSGTLTFNYPANFCGVIQADAYRGPSANGPWKSMRGYQHTIADCAPPTTTTTVPVSPPVTTPPPTTPTPAPVAPVTPPAPATTPPVTPVAPVPHVVPAAPVTPATTSTVATLPRTGVPVVQMILLGGSLVIAGWIIKRRRPLDIGSRS